MKVSAAKKAENRKAILAAATRILREKGPAGLGVAEVMAGAGLTHGGFYGHFASREDLVAAAVATAMDETAAFMASFADAGGIAALAAAYLSEAHLDNVADGCVIAATATEIPRQAEAAREAFADGLRRWLTDGPAGEDKARALDDLATLVGALVLARALKDADRPLALEVLAAPLARMADGTGPA